MHAFAETFKPTPGNYEQYKKAHDELWPELANAMAAHHVNMVIYHYHDRLFLYATAPTREDFERSHEEPVAQKWLEYMATMMVTDDQGKSVVEKLEQVFVFGEFPREGAN